MRTPPVTSLDEQQPVQRLRHLGQWDGHDEREGHPRDLRGQHPIVQRQIAGGGRGEETISRPVAAAAASPAGNDGDGDVEPP